jgi:signal transduction histidine kinase
MKLWLARWHWINWMLYLTRFVWFSIGFVYFSAHPELFDKAPLFVLYMWIVLCCMVPLFFWRPGYRKPGIFTVVEFLLSGSFNLFLAVAAGLNASMFLVPAMMAAYVANQRTLRWAAPLYIILFPVLKIWLGQFDFSDSIGIVVGNSLLFAIGAMFRQMRRLVEENKTQYILIQQKNSALEQYAKQVETLTLQEERSRVAGELHDTVGHTFTSVIVGMDAVRYLMDSSPKSAADKLDQLREMTRKGLDEVRQHIHRMVPQDDNLPLSATLHRLCDDFARHTGTRIDFTWKGEEAPLPRPVRLVFVRTLQEALTNSKRHGEASTVHVSLFYEQRRLTLTVRDNGIGMKDARPGFGLKAMADRLAALHGEVRTSSGPGKGTTLTCTVPLGAQAPPGDPPDLVTFSI